jgi:hypothetical protein
LSDDRGAASRPGREPGKGAAVADGFYHTGLVVPDVPRAMVALQQALGVRWRTIRDLRLTVRLELLGA